MPGFNYRMTGATAVGLAQIKKMKYILNENKKRFEILNKFISQKTKVRDIYQDQYC